MAKQSEFEKEMLAKIDELKVDIIEAQFKLDTLEAKGRAAVWYGTRVTQENIASHLIHKIKISKACITSLSQAIKLYKEIEAMGKRGGK